MTVKNRPTTRRTRTQRTTKGRSIAIGASIAAAGIVISGAGVGYAANGGSFLLGHNNTATTTSTLSNAHAVPLAIVGPAGQAPFKVNSKVRVTNLNADTVDGVDAGVLQRKGAVVRVGETTYTPSEGPINRQSRAWCHAGEHAVGGGAHVSALTDDRLGEYFTFLVHSAPIKADGEPAVDGTQAIGWLVEATNTAHAMTGQTGRDANLTSYVICAPN